MESNFKFVIGFDIQDDHGNSLINGNSNSIIAAINAKYISDRDITALQMAMFQAYHNLLRNSLTKELLAFPQQHQKESSLDTKKSQGKSSIVDCTNYKIFSECLSTRTQMLTPQLRLERSLSNDDV